jgi:hypothetical protein
VPSKKGPSSQRISQALALLDCIEHLQKKAATRKGVRLELYYSNDTWFCGTVDYGNGVYQTTGNAFRGQFLQLLQLLEKTVRMPLNWRSNYVFPFDQPLDPETNKVSR